MIRRIVELLFLVALGAVWGWTQDAAMWSFFGALLGALVWGIFDGLRARRALDWLNKGDASRKAGISGVWGEVVDRGRKLIKKLEKKVANSDARLEDFLSAIQASPNGVVLLDSAGRIEWSNQTASGHLGFEPERDVGQYVRNLVRAPAFVAYLDTGNFGHEIQIDGPGPRSIPKSRCKCTPMGKNGSS